MLPFTQLLRRWLLPIVLVLLLLLSASLAATSLTATKQVAGLEHPWSMVFLPDGEVLVSERAGRLRRIQDNTLLPKPVSGLPAIAEHGQGGLLGLVLHPQFAQNRSVTTYDEEYSAGLTEKAGWNDDKDR